MYSHTNDTSNATAVGTAATNINSGTSTCSNNSTSINNYAGGDPPPHEKNNNNNHHHNGHSNTLMRTRLPTIKESPVHITGSHKNR